VGRLATLAELASPLLAEGGVLVAWKGRRDPDEETEMDRVAGRMAMSPEEVRWVGPYAGSRNRHLHVLRKTGPTPPELPRRPGMAKKRPLGT
jgi:16S rRNA (guanine527-N7)-methyltransferase